MGSGPRSYSHPSLLQQDWVLHRPQKKFSRGGGGGMLGVLPGTSRPRGAHEAWDPADLGSTANTFTWPGPRNVFCLLGAGRGVPGCLQGLTFH